MLRVTDEATGLSFSGLLGCLAWHANVCWLRLLPAAHVCMPPPSQAALQQARRAGQPVCQRKALVGLH